MFRQIIIFIEGQDLKSELGFEMLSRVLVFSLMIVGI